MTLGNRVSHTTSLVSVDSPVPLFSTVLFAHYLGARFLDQSRVLEHVFLWMTILTSVVYYLHYFNEITNWQKENMYVLLCLGALTLGCALTNGVRSCLILWYFLLPLHSKFSGFACTASLAFFSVLTWLDLQSLVHDEECLPSHPLPLVTLPLSLCPTQGLCRWLACPSYFQSFALTCYQYLETFKRAAESLSSIAESGVGSWIGHQPRVLLATALCWTAFWTAYQFEANAILHVVNVTHVLVTVYFSLTSMDRLRLRTFMACEVNLLLTLYCLLTGSFNSPFFLLYVPFVCFVWHEEFHRKSALVSIAVIYTGGFFTFSPVSDETSSHFQILYAAFIPISLLLLAYRYFCYQPAPDSRHSQSNHDISCYVVQDRQLTVYRKRVLGKGAYAKVCEGEFDGMQVAVKMLLLSKNASLRELSMYRKLAAATPSPHIVRYLGSWEGDHDDKRKEDKHYVLILERCETDLNSYLGTHAAALPMHQGLGFLHNICAGLHSLHTLSILHRDLKCANVLLREGVCKLADFGAAIAVSHDEDNAKSLQKMKGTLRYLAPELSSEALATTCSDVYSFGIILWEVFNSIAKKKHQVPYSKQHARDCFALFSLVCRGMRPRVPVGFPVHVLPVYASCVSLTARERPTVSELLRHLIEWTDLCHAKNAEAMWPLLVAKVDNVLEYCKT